MKYEKHVFVCTNQKKKGKKCCGQAHGLALVERMKMRVKELGMKKQIRINKSGCLDACAYGPAMVVYPDGTWYGGVTLEDADEIVDRHLLEDKPEKFQQINFKKPAQKWLKALNEKRNENE